MAAIQITFGNVIEPRLLGNKLNLSPLVVLVSLLVWNKIWGISGMFLAIPIMATLNIIMANIPSLSNISLLISNKPKRKVFRGHEIKIRD
jgi:predicted PurR-regulated permease PerM